LQKVSSAVAGADAVNLDTLLAFPAQGGGLTVQGGHVYVDFGNMPTDKFEQMLKSIRVPVWLTANKTWYVRTDGSDSNDGSADTPDKAFRTINAAAQFVADNYNVSRYLATIRVGPGIYKELIRLSGYTATTGYIFVKGSGTGETYVVQDNTVVDTPTHSIGVF
jgi:hypothetical protein